MPEKCQDCWSCLIKFCSWGLIIWGGLYFLNGLVKLYLFWDHYPAFILIKMVVHRTAPMFASMLVGASALRWLGSQSSKNS